MEFRFLVTLLLAAMMSGCLPGTFNLVRGSGNVKTEQRTVSGFNEVELTGSGNLTIQQTGTEALTIEAEDNLLPLLTSDVAGGKLTLGAKPNTSYSPTKGVTYRLTVKDLRAVGVSSSGSVEGVNLKLGDLRIRISGSGNVRLAGTADTQNIDISGSGNYNGEGLDSRDVVIVVSSSGNATVKANGKLDARVSGSGEVIYIGNPTVTQNVTGSGKVLKR